MTSGSLTADAAGSAPSTVAILVPVYNDWHAATLLLRKIDEVASEMAANTRVILIDDGSVDPVHDELRSIVLKSIEQVSVLPLRRNVGHQRAIAIGLSYLEQHVACDAVVVMDGDGEDDPADIPRLLGRLREEGGNRVVFAERTRRSEGLVFSVFYALYRTVHLILTGVRVRVGNFSVVPRHLLRRLVVVSELWNHYAAAVFVSRIPYAMLPTHRAERLAGRSRMNFVSLVGHGLSAVSVHGERVGVRLLLANFVVILLLLVVLALVVFLRLFTELAVPGWASTVGGLALVLLSQSLLIALVVVFMTLQGRMSPGFLPARDFPYFVEPMYEIARRRDNGRHNAVAQVTEPDVNATSQSKPMGRGAMDV